MNMLENSPKRAIYEFAFPILLSNIFQQIYNLVDMYFIEKQLGTTGVAAIGSVAPLINCLVSLISGCIIGFCFNISNNVGSQDKRKIVQSILGAVLLSLIVGSIILFFSITNMSVLLNFFNIPEELYILSYEYIQIIINGFLIITVYNLITGILRSFGESKIPLLVLIISNFINILLDYVLIINLDYGVFGAGIATILAQFFSVILIIIFILIKYKSINKCYIINISKIEISFLTEQFNMGLSIGVTSALVFLGTLFLQNEINKLGVDIIAGHTISRKISEIFMQPMTCICTSLSIFTAQNNGAMNKNRIKKGIKICVNFCFVWSTLLIIFCYSVLPYIKFNNLSLESIRNVNYYLKANILFYYILSMVFVIRNYLVGMQDKISTYLSGLIELVIKCIFSIFFVQKFGYISIIVCEPIAWFVTLICLLLYIYAKRFINICRC